MSKANTEYIAQYKAERDKRADAWDRGPDGHAGFLSGSDACISSNAVKQLVAALKSSAGFVKCGDNVGLTLAQVNEALASYDALIAELQKSRENL